MRGSDPYSSDEDIGLSGPYDGAAEDLWFLPPEEAVDGATHLGLVVAAEWQAAEGLLAAELAALSFDLGRLAERLRIAPGAARRLALEEAASLSWWTGDRISGDQLALWLSWRIGAAGEGGEGLIRTAWAARRLMAGAGDLTGLLAKERGDPALAAEVTAALSGLVGLSPVTRGCALFHLWKSLDERPDHLAGLEAAVLGARTAGQGGLAFLPLSLTGFGALTAGGQPETRLAGWIAGAHRAVLSALMGLDRLADWQARATAATRDLQGRTPGLLIAALAAHPVLGAPQAEVETGASRAAVQRNLDLLATRGLVREVTGQGRFRIWAAKL